MAALLTFQLLEKQPDKQFFDFAALVRGLRQQRASCIGSEAHAYVFLQVLQQYLRNRDV